MSNFKRWSKFWSFFPPWLIIGAAIILVPIFIFMTYQGIEIQQGLTTKLLFERGEALIRSFEAGVRTGAGMNWGDFQIQKLLIETAQQPGIDYLIITDSQGRIVADSDPSQAGETYGINNGKPPSNEIQWHRVVNQVGADTFEVYRFLHLQDSGNVLWIIYVGLDMGTVVKASEQDKSRLAITALILLLVGFAGLVTLVLAQNYRTAKSYLSQMKIFSDTLIENLPIGLIGIDRNEKIVSFNHTAEKILGMQEKDILGRVAYDVLPEESRRILAEITGKQGIIQKELDYSLGNSRVSVEVVAMALKDEMGEMQGRLILLRDMTEIKLLQQGIERSRRFASIGSLAAGVAHEVRNPLSSIKGFATYFRERYRDNQCDVENADIMINEIERLNRVIGQLLEFARPVDLKMSKSSLTVVIAHAVKLVGGQAIEKGILIKSEIFPQLKDVTIDSDKIKQVLLNLFLNALEAMEKGGSLSVTAAPIADKRFEIVVSDTGRGIAKEGLVRIFDPYYTTKSSGTGLGLAIAHKIIEAHAGQIRIDSEPGKGTTVKISLPI